MLGLPRVRDFATGEGQLGSCGFASQIPLPLAAGTLSLDPSRVCHPALGSGCALFYQGSFVPHGTAHTPTPLAPHITRIGKGGCNIHIARNSTFGTSNCKQFQATIRKRQFTNPKA